MKNPMKRILSLVLTIALLVQIIPAAVFATEPETVTDAAFEATASAYAAERSLTTAETLETAEILFEETSLREENVKHFRLENGQYT